MGNTRSLWNNRGSESHCITVNTIVLFIFSQKFTKIWQKNWNKNWNKNVDKKVGKKSIFCWFLNIDIDLFSMFLKQQFFLDSRLVNFWFQLEVLLKNFAVWVCELHLKSWEFLWLSLWIAIWVFLILRIWDCGLHSERTLQSLLAVLILRDFLYDFENLSVCLCGFYFLFDFEHFLSICFWEFSVCFWELRLWITFWEFFSLSLIFEQFSVQFW